MNKIYFFGDTHGKIDIDKIFDKCFHLRRGQIYHIAGHHIFTMGGALSIDRLRRREFLSWWKQEAISEKELKEALWNIENYKDKIDIVVSHTCPESFLNPLSKQMNISHKIHDENPVKLQKIKEALEDNHQIPKYWICGHWHQDISFKVDTIDFNVLYYHCLCLDKEELKRLDFSEAIIKIKRDRRWGW